MTLLQLKEMTRFIVNEAGLQWLPSADASAFDLTEALQRSYVDYAKETKCFRVSRTVGTAPSTSIYRFATVADATSTARRLFELVYVGYNGADLADLNESRLADDWRYLDADTPEGWLRWGDRAIRIVPEPSMWTYPKTASTTNGSAVVTGASGSTFLTDLVASETLTINGATRTILTVDSNTQVTCTANWTANNVNQAMTVGLYMTWEGYETPDLTAFDEDTESPDVDEADQKLLAIGAAIYVTVKDPSDENQRRASVLWPALSDGYRKAYQRIHRVNGSIEVGRYADAPGLSTLPPYRVS